MIVILREKSIQGVRRQAVTGETTCPSGSAFARTGVKSRGTAGGGCNVSAPAKPFLRLWGHPGGGPEDDWAGRPLGRLWLSHWCFCWGLLLPGLGGMGHSWDPGPWRLCYSCGYAAFSHSFYNRHLWFLLKSLILEAFGTVITQE